jgi:hypothetical protein
MDDNVDLGMEKITGLLADCFNHFGMAVTGIGHTDSTGKIQQSSSIAGVDVGSLSAIGNEVEDTRPGRGHMGKVLGVKLLRGHLISSPINIPPAGLQGWGMALAGVFEISSQ